VAGKAVNARLGTWQVPQLCLPEADKLVSKKIALPARDASDCELAGGGLLASSPLPPPQLDTPATAADAAAAQTHPRNFFDGIRSHPRKLHCLRPDTITNAIENYSYLQLPV
jgi:hypothetical protein